MAWLRHCPFKFERYLKAGSGREFATKTPTAESNSVEFFDASWSSDWSEQGTSIRGS
jgi:hypothetical protein